MYAKSYIDGIAVSEPTWGTCVGLYQVTQHPQLGRILGALASAIRSGAENTHADWGEDWIELSIQWLDGMEPLKTLTQQRDYEALNVWLEEHQQRIITMLHQRLALAAKQGR